MIDSDVAATVIARQIGKGLLLSVAEDLEIEPDGLSFAIRGRDDLQRVRVVSLGLDRFHIEFDSDETEPLYGYQIAGKLESRIGEYENFRVTILELFREAQQLVPDRRKQIGLYLERTGADDKRDLRERRKEHGQCIDCGSPANGSSCDRCKAKHRKAMEEMRTRRIAAGQCVRCARPARPGKLECQIHATVTPMDASTNRARRLTRMANGQCPECGSPANDLPRQLCLKCKAKHKLSPSQTRRYS